MLLLLLCPRFSNRQLDIMMLISLVQRQSMGIKAWHWVRGDFRWHWRLRNDIWTRQMNPGDVMNVDLCWGFGVVNRCLTAGFERSFSEESRRFELKKCEVSQTGEATIQLKSTEPNYLRVWMGIYQKIAFNLKWSFYHFDEKLQINQLLSKPSTLWLFCCTSPEFLCEQQWINQCPTCS